MTWICCRRSVKGWRVGLKAKSDPSFSGHQADGIAPLGKKTNAVRKGAPVAVVARREGTAPSSRIGASDSKAGRARQTPKPRKKRRRLISVLVFIIYLAAVASASLGVVLFRRIWNGADSITPFKRTEKRPFSLARRPAISSTVPVS